MSFNSDVKAEIMERMQIASPRERHAFLSAILRASGSIEIVYSKRNLRLEIEDSSVLLRVNGMIEEEYGTSLKFNLNKESREKDRYYVARLDYNEDILLSTGILAKDDEGNINFTEGIGMDIRGKSEISAYIIGAFLSRGGVYVPSEKKHSGYHLEITFREESIASEVASMLAEFDIFMKKIERNEEYVLYIKESDMICDMLMLMGAKKSYFDLQNLIIERSQRNNANRHGNCSAANAVKVADTGIKHIIAIKYLMDKGVFGTLDEKLKDVAKLRMENPNSSLEELAGLTNPPISKSGLNHRLRKILDMAEELKSKEDKNNG